MALISLWLVVVAALLTEWTFAAAQPDVPPAPGSFAWLSRASAGGGTSHMHLGSNPAAFDCAWRNAAFLYAQSLQPELKCQLLELQAVFDALQLHTMCNKTRPTSTVSSCPSYHATSSFSAAKKAWEPPAGRVLYVDPRLGDDVGGGAIDAPLRSLHAAVLASRHSNQSTTIVLRDGTFYLPSTLQLTPQDSGLSFMSYPGESPVVSGGIPISPKWQAFRVSSTSNIYVTDVANLGSQEPVYGLQVSNRRAILARFPNANPETDLFPKGWISSKTTWVAPKSYPNPHWVFDTEPVRNVSTMFLNYMVGVGGPCSVFDPPVSYWCSKHPSGGGAFTYRLPSGLVYSPSQLPHTPYEHGASGALIDAWRPGHWANWFFRVDAYDGGQHSMNWTQGGFQGARGANEGQEWYISNVFDELDSPREFFFDEAASKLYYYHNGTGAPPPQDVFVVPHLQVLVNHTGTRANPVSDITYKGITFTAAATTIMAPHGVPSGGDWGLERLGAVLFQGTVNAVMDNCTFVRVDGNGIMLSGFNRNATIQNSRFAWIGNTAMASWGYTHEEASSEGLPDGNGIDGTDGDQPRGTRVLHNMVREVGLYEKQSSCWFQAKSAETLLFGNICFNGPRAGFNVNDGFGGGNNVTHNLVFNMCRESQDNGPFNSWDRQPFLTDVAHPGKAASLIPKTNTISYNFMVANYGANGGCVDNDDGSSYYELHHNFFVFGGHKSDFGGHNKVSHNNINVYPQVYGPRCVFLADMPLPGGQFNEGYFNNTCVLTPADPVYAFFSSCDANTPATFAVTLGDNHLYSSVTPQVNCGTTYDLSTWLKFGLDKGTQVHGEPSVQEIMAWGQALLGWQ